MTFKIFILLAIGYVKQNYNIQQFANMMKLAICHRHSEKQFPVFVTGKKPAMRAVHIDIILVELKNSASNEAKIHV